MFSIVEVMWEIEEEIEEIWFIEELIEEVTWFMDDVILSESYLEHICDPSGDIGESCGRSASPTTSMSVSLSADPLDPLVLLRLLLKFPFSNRSTQVESRAQ